MIVPVVVKGTLTAKPVELTHGTTRFMVPVAIVVRMKLAMLVAVPAEFVTLNGPFDAPTGTVAVMLVAELTVNVAAVPLKATAVAPVKLVPVMVTAPPTAPLAGVKLEIVGSTDTV